MAEYSCSSFSYFSGEVSGHSYPLLSMLRKVFGTLISLSVVPGVEEPSLSPPCVSQVLESQDCSVYSYEAMTARGVTVP